MSFQNRRQVHSLDADYTLSVVEAEYATVLVDSSGAARTITMPKLVNDGDWEDGMEVEFKRLGANNVTISFADQKLNDVAAPTTSILTSNGDAVRFVWSKSKASWYTF